MVLSRFSVTIYQVFTPANRSNCPNYIPQFVPSYSDVLVPFVSSADTVTENRDRWFTVDNWSWLSRHVWAVGSLCRDACASLAFQRLVPRLPHALLEPERCKDEFKLGGGPGKLWDLQQQKRRDISGCWSVYELGVFRRILVRRGGSTRHQRSAWLY